MKLAKSETNPLEELRNDYKIIEIDFKKLIDETLKDENISPKEKEKSKNIFVLGLLYWIYDKKLDQTIELLKKTFSDKSEYNIKLLKSGYNYGEITELIPRKIIKVRENLEKGIYRNIQGADAISLALISVSKKINKRLFYGSYPITPASDILHFLSNYESKDIEIFQAEDEIGAICSAIGSSFSGGLGATATSGPGMSLKAEGLGLAVMLELPLVVINVQRGGPSTGLPTKVEQSDLYQSFYGRHGEAPLPIFACKSPSSSFELTYRASKISIEHMTPVIILSDAFLVNSSEPWKVPQIENLDNIKIQKNNKNSFRDNKFYPYNKNENFVRDWRIPTEKGYEHRIGGLEKDVETGNISYDGDNHEKMTQIREAKIKQIENFIPLQKIELGKEKGKNLILSWGGTYGSVKTAVEELLDKKKDISFTHLEYINPLPKNFKDILSNFKNIIIPEINNGQLINILKGKFNINAIGLSKIKGTTIIVEELKKDICNII